MPYSIDYLFQPKGFIARLRYGRINRHKKTFKNIQNIYPKRTEVLLKTYGSFA